MPFLNIIQEQAFSDPLRFQVVPNFMMFQAKPQDNHESFLKQNPENYPLMNQNFVPNNPTFSPLMPNMYALPPHPNMYNPPAQPNMYDPLQYNPQMFPPPLIVPPPVYNNGYDPNIPQYESNNFFSGENRDDLQHQVPMEGYINQQSNEFHGVFLLNL